MIESEVQEVEGTHGAAHEKAISEGLQRYKVGGLGFLSTYYKLSIGPPIIDHEHHSLQIIQCNEEAILVYGRQDRVATDFNTAYFL